MAAWLMSEKDYHDIVEFVAKHDLKKIGLQFPNELVAQSVRVAMRLQDLCSDKQFAILADSPFGGCCVDEIAGQHYSVDGIVHFGSSCLTQISAGVPVIFIFGQSPVDSSAVRSAVNTLTVEGPLLLFYDFVFLESLRQALPSDEHSQLLLTLPALTPPDAEDRTVRCAGRRLPGLESFDEASLGRYALLYVGHRDLALTNVLLSVNHCRSYHLFDVDSGEVTELNRLRELRRRLLLIEKAAAAERIGVLVGALGGGARYVTAVNRLETLIRANGKRCYTLYIGKLTPTKLQNFPNIDCFVMVGCQQNSLFDIRGQEDYNVFQPIVSPYEMEQALKPSAERNWSMDFVTDLERLLLEDEKTEEDGGAKDTSSAVAVPANRIVAERSGEWAVASHLPRRAVEEGHTWFGLQPSVGETPVRPPVRGRSGIAIAYEEEPQ